jgi:hypothetical protein
MGRNCKLVFRILPKKSNQDPKSTRRRDVFNCYSSGKWDGDTLDVDTVGFKDRATLDGMGLRLTIDPPEKTIFSSTMAGSFPVPQFALSPDSRTIALIASAPGTAWRICTRSSGSDAVISATWR